MHIQCSILARLDSHGNDLLYMVIKCVLIVFINSGYSPHCNRQLCSMSSLAHALIHKGIGHAYDTIADIKQIIWHAFGALCRRISANVWRNNHLPLIRLAYDGVDRAGHCSYMLITWLNKFIAHEAGGADVPQHCFSAWLIPLACCYRRARLFNRWHTALIINSHLEMSPSMVSNS